MGLEAIYFVAQIIAACAIVASLVYVGVQIRQNSAATQAASREAVSVNTINLLMQLSADDGTTRFWRGAMMNPEALDADGRLRRDMIAYAIAEGWEMAFAQWRRGMLSDHDWEKWDRIILSYMAAPGFAEFWRSGGSNLGAQFKNYVDSLDGDPVWNFDDEQRR